MRADALRRRPGTLVRHLVGAAAILLLALGASSFGTVAHAHSGFQSYVYVSIFDDALDGRVEYPINDLGPALGIDFPEDADERLSVARERADEIIAYTDANLDLADPDDQSSWQLTFDPEFAMLETAAGDYLQVSFEVEETFEDAPRRFFTTYSGIIESNPERDALFLVENDWGSATFGNEGEHLLGFSVGAETQFIDVEEVPTTESITEVARRGSVAVDRSAVVLAGLIAVVAGALLGDRRQTNDVDWRIGLRRLGIRLAWFAGPAVLMLAALGFTSPGLSLSTALTVGAVGAVLAAMATRLQGPAAASAVALAGAAAGVVLAEQFLFQQLDRSRPALAFLGFAAGAIGTMLFVAAMLTPMGVLLRRVRWASVVADVVAALVAVAGAVWFVEQLVGTKFPLREGELLVTDLVTSPIVVAVATAVVAAVVVRGEIRRGSDDRPDDPSAPTESTTPDPERIEA